MRWLKNTLFLLWASPGPGLENTRHAKVRPLRIQGGFCLGLLVEESRMAKVGRDHGALALGLVWQGSL